MLRSQILNAVEIILKELPYFARVVYWQDLPSDFGQDWCTFRDVEETYTEVGRQHECRLTVEIELVLFGGDSPARAQLRLAELIEELGRDRTLGGTARQVQIIRTATEVQTAGLRACSTCLEIAVIYRTSLFNLGG
ncbi:MAG: hypothetical protein DDT26_00100 [Dehalococcoidia bacterium]|nr:hypothetical protein [Chloroflexota bacterium]